MQNPPSVLLMTAESEKPQYWGPWRSQIGGSRYQKTMEKLNATALPGLSPYSAGGTALKVVSMW